MAQKAKRKRPLHPRGTKSRSHKQKKVGPREAARLSAVRRNAGVLLEFRDIRLCQAPVRSLNGKTMVECGAVISAGQQHRYFPDALGRDQPICMRCVYRLQGVGYLSPAPRQGFKLGED